MPGPSTSLEDAISVITGDNIRWSYLRKLLKLWFFSSSNTASIQNNYTALRHENIRRYCRSRLQRLSRSGIEKPENDRPGNMNISSREASFAATSFVFVACAWLQDCHFWALAISCIFSLRLVKANRTLWAAGPFICPWISAPLLFSFHSTLATTDGSPVFAPIFSA